MRDLLTARFVESVKATGVRETHPDGLVPGLDLRVAPSGVKSWTVRYRVGRRLRRWTIGTYPGVSLAEARDRAREGLRDLDRGHDPALEKVERREADTFAELAKRYLEEHAQPRKRSWKDDRRILERQVLPEWRHRLARDIKRRDVRQLVDGVALRGAPILANRVRALLHTVFAFGVSVEVLELNPVIGVPRPGIERQRDRVLNDDEIRKFWQALESLEPCMAAVFRLRLVTAQRGGEVVNMRWLDVDLVSGWWTIPVENSKNKLPHRVPLSAPAVDVIAALLQAADKDETFVFTGARGKRQRSEAAATFCLPNFKGHDLRRTAASYMASAGVSRLVIAKVLNHVERGVTAVYDRHSYDGEKRTALDVWSSRLQTIVESNRPANRIVAFPGA